MPKNGGLFDFIAELADLFSGEDTPQGKPAGADDRESPSGDDGHQLPLSGLFAAAAAIGLHALQSKAGQVNQNDAPRSDRDKKAARGRARDAIGEMLRENLRQFGSEVRSVTEPVWKNATALKHRIKFGGATAPLDRDQEPLLDREAAKTFFEENRQILYAARESLDARRAMLRQDVLSQAGPVADDPIFAEKLDQSLDAKMRRMVKHIDFIEKHIDEAEAAIDDLRKRMEFAEARQGSLVEGARFLCFPAETDLTPLDLERLNARIMRPESQKLSRLIDDTRGSSDIRKATIAIDIDAQILADAAERIAVIDFVNARFRFAHPFQVEWSHIRSCGIACFEALSPKPLPITPHDAARMAAAFTLTGESDSASVPLMAQHWPKFERAVPDLWTAVRTGLSPQEAAAFVDRLERNVGDGRGPPGPKGFSHPHLELIDVLRDLACRPGRGPVWAAYEAYLAKREAHRAKVLALASPVWRDQFAIILDTPNGDERTRPRTVRQALLPLGRLDRNALNQVAADLKALEKEPRPIYASKADDWKWLDRAFTGGSIGAHALSELRDLLAGSEKRWKAYFADALELPKPGAFEAFLAAFAPDERRSLLVRDVAPLLTAGHYPEALATVRQWIERAPPHPLRQAIMDIGIDDVKLRGFSSHVIAPLDDSIAAVGIDLSLHTMDGFAAGSTSPLHFEVSAYHREAFDFDALTIAELNNVCKTYPSPWQGKFEKLTLDLELIGLAQMPAELLRAPHPEACDDLRKLHAAIRALGEWWLFCLTAVKLRQEIDGEPNYRPLTFVLGTHDFGSFIPHVALR